MKRGRLEMSGKERERMVTLSRVAAGELSLKQAAALMGVSYRQAKRLNKRFKRRGAAGLIHRGRGRPSGRRKSAALRRRALSWVRRRYADFGPTLAAEKLAERHDIVVDHETLRRWRIEQGLWRVERRRSKHRQRRERRGAFGELLQMDGSPHDWFEGRGPKCCLMEMVDDATGVTMGLFSEQETTEVALRLLLAWTRRHGIARALYVDRKNAFLTEREPTTEELQAGIEPLTAFGQVCKRLGIDIIPAYSPQAKGRVERKHGLAQDRLIKELRLAGISTIQQANAFVPRWTEAMNRRFAVAARDDADAHRPVDPLRDLDSVFAWESPRTLANDWTVRYENRIFQLGAQSPLPPAKSRLTVRRRLDGQIEILYRGRSMQWREIAPARPVLADPPELKETAPIAIRSKSSGKAHKPPPDHPWRRRAIRRPAHAPAKPALLGALPPDPRSLSPSGPSDGPGARAGKNKRPGTTPGLPTPSARPPASALGSLSSVALSSGRATQSSPNNSTLSPGKRGHF